MREGLNAGLASLMSKLKHEQVCACEKSKLTGSHRFPMGTDDESFWRWTDVVKRIAGHQRKQGFIGFNEDFCILGADKFDEIHDIMK